MYVISAFTSKYQKFAEELEQSIKKQGIDKYKIYYYDDRKDWAKNTQIKPEILLKAINEYNEPVLWVDADAEIYGDLNYFINLPDYIDIGVYYLNTKHKPNEMLSGTLYFGNTATSKQILTQWQNICNTNKKWDQINLQKIVDRTACSKIVFPSDYIVISGTHRTWQQDVKKIIIYHKQASREVRRGKL